MRNAKKEFLETLTRLRVSKVKCVDIRRDVSSYDIDGDILHYRLKMNYTDEEYQTFLNSLDFNYDGGYGTQELYGAIWLENGTWLDRSEYDGSEWWEYHVLPQVPDYLVKD